jgi:hypothetical protein
MMGSDPPDHPGYLLVPVTPDPTQATKPLALYESRGYRIVPNVDSIVVSGINGSIIYVWMQLGYGGN